MRRIAVIALLALLALVSTASASPGWLRQGAYATYVVKSTLPTGTREFEISWTVQEMNQTYVVIEQRTRILGAKDLPGPFPRTYSIDTVRVHLENRDTYITLPREGTLSHIGKTEFWIPTNLTENSRILIFTHWYGVERLEKLTLNQSAYDAFFLKRSTNEETRKYWYDSKTGLLLKYELKLEYELNPQVGGGIFRRDDVAELVSTNVGSPIPVLSGTEPYIVSGMALLAAVIAWILATRFRRAHR